ncbi:MAG TPA: hypothetical protein VG711_12810, partial [Phycisphaerales bacterium]|nr:hypothetical protein [Phycisphaerales bacterium]
MLHSIGVLQITPPLFFPFVHPPTPESCSSYSAFMPAQSLARILNDPRFFFIAIFGFASGMPYMLTGRTLKVWAASQKIDLTTVGLLSLITLPYSLKFIWAPLMDRISVPVLGRR